jgi:putative tricarboxylic transport membrane protein
VFHHRWLFLRSSFIGVFVGIIPGVGGETAPFVAYASAQQISKHPEQFGKGTIEGVIAPESSNNAKEGGALVPTLAFGIPGSSAMALLLGGFLILGLEPGPEFLKNHLDIAFGLALVVAVANVLAAVVMIAVAPKISLVTRIEGHVLGPLLLVLVVLGAYSTSNNAIDVVFVFVFGLLGYFMRALGFSRPALLLGFVLGTAAETYLHISLNAYGGWFFLRPISLALAVAVVMAIFWPLVRRIRGGFQNG